MTRDQRTGWLGLATVAGFTALLIGFAAARADYAHATRAISELGTVGAPNALAWNLTGFLAVGLGLALFGWRLGRARGSRVATGALTLFGLAFAATAVPADMSDLSSAGSLVHIAASQAVLLFWVVGVAALTLNRNAGAGLRWICGLALALAVGSIVVRGAELLPPGYSQRLSFAVIFGWAVASGLSLLRRSGTGTPQEQAD